MSPKNTPPPSAAPLALVPGGGSRMTVANIVRGKRAAPDRIIVHGTEGVGKSTLASEAPNPIFIAVEDGVRHLNVASFPEPQNFDDVVTAVDSLVEGDHDFKTLVVDTIDWVGHLLKDKVQKANRWTSEDFDKYGRGYKVWIEDWRKLLQAFDRLRAKKGMEIILLVHSGVGNFKNPAGDDYMRYVLAIGGTEAPELLKQWADIILFLVHEEFTTDPKKGRVKGVSTGKRLLKTERTAAWDAKNRHHLPSEIEVSIEGGYAAFDEARRAGSLPADPAVLAKECLRLMGVLELPQDHTARKFIAGHQTDAAALDLALISLRQMASEAGVQ